MVVTEKAKKRIVRGFVTKDCLIWLVAVLNRFVEELKYSAQPGGDVETGRRWRDHQGSVTAAVRSNRCGSFVLLSVVPGSKKRRRVHLCLPTSLRDGGWKVVDEAMAKLVGAAVKESQPQMAARVVSTVDPKRSFVNVLRGEGGDDSRREKGEEAGASDSVCHQR